MANYRERLCLKTDGDDCTFLATGTGLQLANGYQRIFFQPHRPIVEFETQHIVKNNLFVLPNHQWRLTSPHSNHEEFRSTDVCCVRVVHQKQSDEHGYEADKWYISAFDLYDKNCKAIVDPISHQTHYGQVLEE